MITEKFTHILQKWKENLKKLFQNSNFRKYIKKISIRRKNVIKYKLQILHGVTNTEKNRNRYNVLDFIVFKTQQRPVL